MNQELVREAVQVLKTLRADKYGKVEDSVADELDEIIQELESSLQTGSEPDLAQRALELLGMALQIVGIVVSVMELISR